MPDHHVINIVTIRVKVEDISENLPHFMAEIEGVQPFLRREEIEFNRTYGRTPDEAYWAAVGWSLRRIANLMELRRVPPETVQIEIRKV